MSWPSTVFLFDIDGVLVEPLGYRAAIQATLDYFTDQMGLGKELCSSQELSVQFEAQRITSEWDMVPITLAILFDWLSACIPGLELPASLPGAIASIRDSNFSRIQILESLRELDTHEPIQRIGEAVTAGEFPSETALRLSYSQPDFQQSPNAQTLFPALKSHPLLAELLSHTRDIERSRTTRLFQQFSLGSATFEDTYGLEPEVETPSMLSMHDRPLLTTQDKTELLYRKSQNQLALAAYTLRPSLPPRQVPESRAGYAPEAEMALNLVGLSGIPLIGYGRIRYLALKKGKEPEALIKPSAVQALAAVFAALTEQEYPALEMALAVQEGQRVPTELRSRLPESSSLNLHVFEDSTGGIEAAGKAVKLLAMNGIAVKIQSWGIANHPIKVASLERSGTVVYANIEDALRKAIGMM